MKRLGFLGMTLLAILFVPSHALAVAPPVRVVLFTHVEDTTPGGVLGTTQSRQNYVVHRNALLAMASLAESTGVQWTLQPDWKILEAALLYEDASLTASTGGKNFLRYLKEDRGVVIDPHSHESGGYNYTDVAHLLDSLGVGGSTVIGGHVWDPSLPQFAEWDRFRVPVAGQHYPAALWRGDILMGSGTPNHVNDPLVSGVWRPRDRDHYFEHDPNGNIVAIGAYKHSVASIAELIDLYRSGLVPETAMLTFSTNLNPSTLTAPGGLASIVDTVITPIVAWRDSGLVVDTDFTSLVATWQTQFGGLGYLYDAEAGTVGVEGPPMAPATLSLWAPNPIRSGTLLRYSVAKQADVRMAIYDLSGREVAELVRDTRGPGEYSVRWEVGRAPCGAYVCRIEARHADGTRGSFQTMKLLVLR